MADVRAWVLRLNPPGMWRNCQASALQAGIPNDPGQPEEAALGCSQVAGPSGEMN